MKRKLKIPTAAIVAAIAVLMVISGILFYYREQSFLDILPADPMADEVTATIQKSDQESSAPLSSEVFQQFIKDMSAFKYRKVKESNVMNSFGDVIYVVEGDPARFVEIRFSGERGGLILVNDMDKEGLSPVYEILSEDCALEALFDRYVEAAASQNANPVQVED